MVLKTSSVSGFLRLQSDQQELKFVEGFQGLSVGRASIGPAGIEIGASRAAARILPPLQSDQQELKLAVSALSQRQHHRFNRTSRN